MDMNKRAGQMRLSAPMLTVAVMGLAFGVSLLVAACQPQGESELHQSGGYQVAGLNVRDYPLDEDFIVEMVARRPNAFEHSYTYMDFDGPDSVRIREVADMGGVRYELGDVAQPQLDESWERPVKSVRISVTKSVPAADKDSASGYFSHELDYEQGGFVGVLARGACVNVQPEHEVLTRQVDRTVSYFGLASNDASDLPQTKSFEVSSADGVTIKDLSLSDVRYEVEAFGPDGTPASYRALANYRGTEEYLTTPGYSVTYEYAGEVAMAGSQMVINARYDAVLPWGEALVGVVAFGPVSEVADAISVRCS